MLVTVVMSTIQLWSCKGITRKDVFIYKQLNVITRKSSGHFYKESHECLKVTRGTVYEN